MRDVRRLDIDGRSAERGGDLVAGSAATAVGRTVMAVGRAPIGVGHVSWRREQHPAGETASAAVGR